MSFLSKTIVTAALPYSYSIPHLGNFVGSVLPADVYFKYLKMGGEDAIFICGSDQHGTPTEIKAMERKQRPEDFANEMHDKTKSAFDKFDCSFTYYGKTNSEQNRETVYKIFQALHKNGYIGETQSLQPYCNFDKRFLVDRFIEGTCPHCKSDKARGDQCDNCGRLLDPKDIINPRCKICGKSDISFLKVKHLAIRLDLLQGKIEKFIETNSKNNWPKAAKNKSLSYIKEGLKPRDITRRMDWGFKVPLEGFTDSVLYVWFEAVIGYIGITSEWDKKKSDEYWLAKETKLIQFMGKDNIEFHTLMWPGILLGSNLGYVLPTTIKSAEYLTSNAEKFSKSRGIGLDLEKAVEILPSDYWRFTLMYLYPETSDSEFTLEILKEVINNILNDKIGNFSQRVIKFSIAHQDLIGKIELHGEYKEKVEAIKDSYSKYFNNMQLREALHSVVELATLGNTILSERRPWEMAKDPKVDKKELSEMLESLLAMVYYVDVLLYPFTPNASRKSLLQFSIKKDPSFEDLKKKISIDMGTIPQPMFSKIGEEELAKFE